MRTAARYPAVKGDNARSPFIGNPLRQECRDVLYKEHYTQNLQKLQVKEIIIEDNS